jgi:hypothetical protein
MDFIAVAQQANEVSAHVRIVIGQEDRFALFHRLDPRRSGEHR